MSRFQLLIREPGKAPRYFPLTSSVIVGRARTVDCAIDDDEVGRQQFRIGVKSGFVVLEDLGATNRTIVDNSTIEPRAQTALSAGAVIRAGKTEFVIEPASASGDHPPLATDSIDQTMIAPARPGIAPARPGATPTPAPAADEPLNTMAFRPGAAPFAKAPQDPPAPDSDVPLNTMAFRPPGLAGQPKSLPTGDSGAKAPRPGSNHPSAKHPAPAAPKHMPAGTDDEPLNTMAFRPPGLPGIPAAPPPSDKPADGVGKSTKHHTPAEPNNKHEVIDQTMVRAFRPGGANPPTTNSPTQSPLPNTLRTSPSGPQPVAAPAASDFDSALQQDRPRLFVKGGSLKRQIRLTKPLNTVGRAETADVSLPHDSVSEQHAQLRLDGQDWRIRDSGSTNGSTVDNERLDASEKLLRRNALIGIGALNLIFLSNNKATARQDRREDDRALQLLIRSGHIDKYTANEIRQLSRAEASRSVAEIVLQDTTIAAADWAKAAVDARRRSSMFWRILRLLTGRK